MMIVSTNLANARLMDFYQVMSLTAGYLEKEDLGKLMLTAYQAEFKKSFDSLDASMKQAMKTGYTNALIAADDARDDLFTGFVGFLRSMTRFPDKAMIGAAEKLLLVVEKYGYGLARFPQREETAAITNLVQDLRNAENTPLVETIGAKVWTDKLDESNRAFDDLYSHRSEKDAQFITGLTRTERVNMQAAFDKLAQAINSLAFINGEAAYKALADKNQRGGGQRANREQIASYRFGQQGQKERRHRHPLKKERREWYGIPGSMYPEPNGGRTIKKGTSFGKHPYPFASAR